MAFQYDPKSASNCLPAGEYTAQLESVEEKVSSKGNPMLEVHWLVVVGHDHTVYDYIVNPQTIWKLKKIAKAWGKIDEFEDARFDLTEHIGKTIGLKLVVDQQPGYSDKNSVKDYLPNGDIQPFTYDPGVPDSVPASDGIPF